MTAKKPSDCVLNSVCCDSVVMCPVAWWGTRTSYKCEECGSKWVLNTDPFSTLSEKTSKEIKSRDLDFQIEELEKEKEKNDNTE